MTRRPGDSEDNGFKTFLGAVATGIGVGVGALALLYAFNNETGSEASSHQFNDTDTIIADSEAKCRKAAAIIRRHCNSFGYLGMDCLWTNNRRNVREQVGLLQLATSQGFCLIVRISDLQNNICPELANILNDTDILKVGVGVHQKALFITDDHKIAIRGTLELSLLASKAYIPERKLTDLAKALCNINIKKTQELAAVDWNKSNLTSNEKEYAKNRAIATIKVFEKLRDIMIRQQGIEVYNSIEERLSERDLI